MRKKKEPQKKEPVEQEAGQKKNGFSIAPKFSSLSETLLAILKFILGLCLLPLVYSVSVSFVSFFSSVDSVDQAHFWAGVVSFVIVYLFVGEPAVLYESGQKLLEVVFGFFQPFVKVAPNLLPIFSILVSLTYGIISIFVHGAWLLHWALFFSGFFIVLHLVFSAKTVRTGKDDFLKGNYIFSFSFIYIINVVLAALFIGIAVKGFSLGGFFTQAGVIYKDIFYAVFKQLFLY